MVLLLPEFEDGYELANIRPRDELYDVVARIDAEWGRWESLIDSRYLGNLKKAIDYKSYEKRDPRKGISRRTVV